jgi:Fic family protein
MLMENQLVRIEEKKKKLDSFRPLPPELVKNLDEWLKIELTYTSNAIEGNTLSHGETALIVEKGLTIGGKTVTEHLEAINHAKAIDFIKELVCKKKEDISLDDILSIHRIILQGIDSTHAGIFRTVMVRGLGSNTVFPNYLKVPTLMTEFMMWLNSTQDHPVKVAAMAHLRLVKIHPFVDGNGRTARLLMNLILLQHGYPIAIIKKEARKTYIDALEASSSTDDNAAFNAIVFQAVESSLDIYLEAISQSKLTSAIF